MTNLVSERSIMEIEETDFRSAISEPLIKKIGSNMNALIDAKDENYLLGAIFWAYLTEAQAQAELDSTWVEMRGQSVAGSDLDTTYSISTLPDCRGQFIRSLDAGGGQDPDSPRSVSSLQTAAYRPHAHSMVGADPNPSLPGIPNPSAPYLGSRWASGETIMSKDSAVNLNTGPSVGVVDTAESRPNNIALGLYIKVNN